MLPHRNSMISTRSQNFVSRKDKWKKWLLGRDKDEKKLHHSTYYDSESKRIVDKLYEKDIATFGRFEKIH